MVVGKVMRWSPWAPSPPKKTKIEARLTVASLDGLAPPVFTAGDTVAVRISPNSPAKPTGGINSYFGRKKKSGDAAASAAVGPTGTAEFDRFGSVVNGGWVSFLVSRGKNRDEGGKGQKRKEKKMEEIGSVSIDIEDWLCASSKRSQDQEQRHKLAITLEKDGFITEATLYISVSFVERTSVMAKYEENSDDSCTFDADYLDLYKLLALADDIDKVVEFKSRIGTASTSSGSTRSSPDQQIGSVAKCRRIQADPNGSWERVELISRDRQTKLKSQAFFASIDQRDESAGGESACTALVAVIAAALHSKQPYTPIRSEFDNLIRQGSLEWQKLCNEASYIARFPNKHFDLDTVLEAKIRPVSVSRDKSFVGFFQPESFQSLRGAMSFDGIWEEITTNITSSETRIYIVSWNDHFFVLKLDSDAYYIIDTLGERLFEGCAKAYMLKFEESTEMYRSSDDGKGDGDETICRGKECCREFVKRFLAAIPLREELEMEEKGTGNANTALHQRLQIEFHLTVAFSEETVIDEW